MEGKKKYEISQCALGSQRRWAMLATTIKYRLPTPTSTYLYYGGRYLWRAINGLINKIKFNIGLNSFDY
jgi:hypothetical protein